jgi:hypothetical protein
MTGGEKAWESFGERPKNFTTESTKSAESAEEERVRIWDPETLSFPASANSALSVVKIPDPHSSIFDRGLQG